MRRRDQPKRVDDYGPGADRDSDSDGKADGNDKDSDDDGGRGGGGKRRGGENHRGNTDSDDDDDSDGDDAHRSGGGGGGEWQAARCPGGHPLERYTTSVSETTCDECGDPFQRGTRMRGCNMVGESKSAGGEQCDYDVCRKCVSKMRHKVDVAVKKRPSAEKRTVTQLKAALKGHGLLQKGKKTELSERLKAFERKGGGGGGSETKQDSGSGSGSGIGNERGGSGGGTGQGGSGGVDERLAVLEKASQNRIRLLEDRRTRRRIVTDTALIEARKGVNKGSGKIIVMCR